MVLNPSQPKDRKKGVPDGPMFEKGPLGNSPPGEQSLSVRTKVWNFLRSKGVFRVRRGGRGGKVTESKSRGKNGRHPVSGDREIVGSKKVEMKTGRSFSNSAKIRSRDKGRQGKRTKKFLPPEAKRGEPHQDLSPGWGIRTWNQLTQAGERKRILPRGCSKRKKASHEKMSMPHQGEKEKSYNRKQTWETAIQAAEGEISQNPETLWILSSRGAKSQCSHLRPGKGVEKALKVRRLGGTFRPHPIRGKPS